MKKCPNCQKTFDNDKRFCQIDGTPLVDVVETVQEDENPFKTVVMGQQPPLSAPVEDAMKTMVISADSKDDDILQIPEVFDPMKTVVVSEPIKFDKPAPPVSEEPSISTPEIPKFNEPSLTPPNFNDLAANEPPKVEAPKTETPLNPFSEPPKFDKPIANPFNEPAKFDSPFSAPVNEPPKSFDPPKFEPTPASSPFDAPKNEPVQSPIQASEPQTPFKEPGSPFNPPASPFDSTPFQANDPVVNAPVQQMEWNAPNPPVEDWQNQSVGADTPFQTPQPGTGVENKTLATVSLVLGILSFLCLGPLGGIGAVITGYMQKSKIKSNPGEYGGGGLATVGIILGVINIIFGLIGIVLWLLLLTGTIRF